MLYDLLFHKEDPLYDAAILALTGIQTIIKLDGEKREMPIDMKNVFHRVSREKNSPAILWIDENQYIAYYPPYSGPCQTVNNSHSATIEVLKGTIYCKQTYKRFRQGEKFTIDSENNHMPYTREAECYLRVIMG